MMCDHCCYLGITEFGNNMGGGRIGELSKTLFHVEFEMYILVAVYLLFDFLDSWESVF